MANYLVKTYDRRGRLIGRFEFAAPNDDEAEGAVGDLREDASQELWCGQRWVRTWPSDESARTSGETPGVRKA